MFLESKMITGDRVLIPTSRIKYIHCGLKDEGGYFVKLASDDGDLEELFGDDIESMHSRFNDIYNMIHGFHKNDVA